MALYDSYARLASLCKALLIEIFIYYLYIPKIYTKMEDLYYNTILCTNCNKKTVKTAVIKDGFKIRALKCPNCNKEWYHPLDMQRYKNFQELKNKEFSVKLRMVGNSFCVSIPKEIIEFEERFALLEKEIDNLIRMSLEEPGKLSLFFSKKIKE